MLKWLGIIGRTLRSALRTQRDLAIENLALRQQLAILKHRQGRPRLTDADRLFRVSAISNTSCRATSTTTTMQERIYPWKRMHPKEEWFSLSKRAGWLR